MAKFTNDEIDNLISESKTNAEIARAMGMTQTSVNARINRRRAELEKPRTTKPLECCKASEPEPKPKPAEPTGSPFPFTYGEQIMYDGRLHIVNSVGQDRMIIRENATLTPKTITVDDFERNKALFKKLKPKSENQYENIVRNRPDEEPDRPQRITAGDIKVNGQPIKTLPDSFKEKIVDKLKENKKASTGMSEAIADAYGLPAKEPKKPGMTINPVFEAAVQEMEAQHKAKKEPIAPPESMIREDVKSAIADTTNIKLDLEIESSADPVSPFTVEPEGYIDPEWFNTLPRKGTVEYRIWQKAIQGIKDINAARDEIKKALEVGDRLPAPYVERYNRIASKYSEEAGA